MQTFVDDDEGYLAWLEANPTGFVVNTTRTPTNAYLVLHRASCGYIRSSEKTNWTTTNFIKVCSEQVADLEEWAKATSGGLLNPCQRCKPDIEAGGPAGLPSTSRPPSVPDPVPQEPTIGDLLFSTYPQQGRALLARRAGGNCRKGYGLQLQKLTGQTDCAYCGLSLVSSYEQWLLMQVDHVVPFGTGKALGIPVEWLEDCSNLVLACAACNSFCNRDTIPVGIELPGSLEDFYALRDRMFRLRRQRILGAHQKERAFFEGRPWEKG